MPGFPSLAVPGKFTRRLAAVTLIGQAMTIFFGALAARQFALAGGEGQSQATTYLIGGSALAVLCVLASGLLRRPGGIALGWIIQLLTFACAIVLPAMIIVGLIFTGVWWLCLAQGHKVDAITAQWEAEDEAASQQPPDED
ncbi:MAG: DUF4233 domain-containing protein [Ornithinimicrobium sp.]